MLRKLLVCSLLLATVLLASTDILTALAAAASDIQPYKARINLCTKSCTIPIDPLLLEDPGTYCAVHQNHDENLLQ